MIQTAKQVKDDEKCSIQKQITKSITVEEGIKQLFPNYKFSMEQIKHEIKEIETHLEKFFMNLKDKEFPSKEKPYPTAYSLDNDSGILLYLLCRIIKPNIVVETGVAYGRSTACILQALNENHKGTLYSIDGTFRPWETKEMIGSAIPENLKNRWEFSLGTTRSKLKNILEMTDGIDIFIHDSLHTYQNMTYEFNTVWPYIKKNGYLLSDDIMGNNAFYDFYQLQKIKPIIFQQNSDNASFGLLKKENS